MADKREDILARLVEVAADVSGVVFAGRNVGNIDDEDRPAIVIMDADEAADESDPVNVPRGTSVKRRVGLTPEIYILLGDKPENIGTELNAFRAKLIKAVLTDATLQGIVGTNGAIRYEGCATALSRGRSMEGEMGVSFTFSYILNPAEL
jgi:hypothetical protein